MPDQATWDAVADLFIYPEERLTPTIKAACHLLAAEGGPLGAAAKRFLQFVEDVPATEREEVFTRTFDINPACSLELGWQLFGEEYARGTFLVDMRQTMRALGVEETGELPDHLVHALRVLGRLVPLKAKVFSTTYVQPALMKMLTGFTDAESPWHGVLTALGEALLAEYGDAVAPETVSTPSRPTPYDIPAEGCSAMGCAPEACSPEATTPEVR